MITHLTLRNFKSVKEQEYDFTQFDLLVGANNSGKSTVLQALAIWQFCINEFQRSKREGEGKGAGIQVILPNFSALPVPEFTLLWKDRIIRRNPTVDGKTTQEYTLIQISLKWLSRNGESQSFGVALRYQTPQTIYAIPSEGWSRFRELENNQLLPTIAYVPPFSGLEPIEEWRDDGPIRKQVGKGQPGSVLRNLLYRVVSPSTETQTVPATNKALSANPWNEIVTMAKKWFNVTLLTPEYKKGIDTQIIVNYFQGVTKGKDSKNFDIISAGSGFHQTLTLLGFLYGYKPTTILLDEPDAHLHVKLQREVLDYFKKKSNELNIQFLIATHAEEFVKGVDANQIISVVGNKPNRIESSAPLLKAMSAVSNEEMTQTILSPYIIYVEGENDERILRSWSECYGKQDVLKKFTFKTMNGGDKKSMYDIANDHFDALKLLSPNVKRLMLFDYDTSKSWHPDERNINCYEWKRMNIENYFLVSCAWKRAAAKKLSVLEDDLLFQPVSQLIDNFFASENLTKPINQSWKAITANVFSVVNGKHLLFENVNALFNQLKSSDSPVKISRSDLAMNMLPEEIHGDVDQLFEKLKSISSAIDN